MFGLEGKQEQIKAIMEDYGLEDLGKDFLGIRACLGLEEELVSSTLQAYITDIPFFTNAYYDYHKKFEKQEKKLAELIQFLRACEGSEIVLRSTITKPKGNQIKNTEAKIKITNNDFFLESLASFLNTKLYYSIPHYRRKPRKSGD